jgi:hypothetical protein
MGEHCDGDPREGVGIRRVGGRDSIYPVIAFDFAGQVGRGHSEGLAMGLVKVAQSGRAR